MAQPNSDVPPLSSDYRVVSVSLRHHYPERWDGKASDYTIEQHASDLAAFINRICAPVHLVAHSIGGSVALEVAGRRPELLRKLVLVQPPSISMLPPAEAADFEDTSRKRLAVVDSRFAAGDIEGALQYVLDINLGPGG